MTDVVMPRLSDTMTDGVIHSWLVQEGDSVQRGDIIAEIETDKAVMELEAYETGVLSRILKPEGSKAAIGEPIAVIGEPAETRQTSTPSSESESPSPEAKPAAEPSARSHPAPHAEARTPEGKMRATPLVRRLAREHDLDLSKITGTGPQGRIIRADVQAVLTSRQQPVPAPERSTSASFSPPSPTDEHVALSPIRKTTARRLSQSAAIPHFHLTGVVDAGELLAMRAELNRQVFDDRCSLTDLLVRAVAMTLASHREVNASWDGDQILRHGQINVGVAVALDDGLIVPVIRDADHKSVAQIAAESRELTTTARAGKLTPDQFTGGTFTISNLGMFDIEHFAAVINPPEAAILAVGTASDEAAVREGQIVVRPTMRLTMTSDHRVLDGAVSAAFLNDLVDALERPMRLLA